MMEMFDDPAFKTTDSNYKFKYVPGEDFERIIRNVQRDRIRMRRDSLLQGLCKFSKASSEQRTNSLKSALVNAHTAKKPTPPLSQNVETIQTSTLLKKHPTKVNSVRILSKKEFPMPFANSMTRENVRHSADHQPQEKVKPDTQRSSIGGRQVPVRILSDAEIKDIIESAVKEVMDPVKSTASKSNLKKEKPRKVQKNSIPETKPNEVDRMDELYNLYKREKSLKRHPHIKIPRKPEILDTKYHTIKSNHDLIELPEATFPPPESDYGSGSDRPVKLTDREELATFTDVRLAHNKNKVEKIETLKDENPEREIKYPSTKSIISLKKTGDNQFPVVISDHNLTRFTSDEKISQDEINDYDSESHHLSPAELQAMNQLLGIRTINRKNVTPICQNEREMLDSSDDETTGKTDKQTLSSKSSDGEKKRKSFKQEETMFPVVKIKRGVVEEDSDDDSAEHDLTEDTMYQKADFGDIRKEKSKNIKINFDEIESHKNQFNTLDVQQKPTKVMLEESYGFEQYQDEFYSMMQEEVRGRGNHGDDNMDYGQKSPFARSTKTLYTPPQTTHRSSSKKSPDLLSQTQFNDIAPITNKTKNRIKKSSNKAKTVKPVEYCSGEETKEQKFETSLIFTKITSYQQKICTSLDEIKQNLKDMPELDPTIDLNRRQRRAAEFTIRFARNYLYQIGRITEDIRISTKEVTSRTNYRESYESNMKIYNLYTIILQGIQSYTKNMMNFIIHKSPEKLKSFLNLILNGTELCIEKKFFDRHDFLIQTILEKCNDLLEFLQEMQQSSPHFVRTEFKKARGKDLKLPMRKWELPVKNKLAMYDAYLPQPVIKRKTGIPGKSSRIRNSSKQFTGRQSEAKIGLSRLNKARRDSLGKIQDRCELSHDLIKKRSPRINTTKIEDINTVMETVGIDDSDVQSNRNPTPKVLTVIHDVQSDQRDLSAPPPSFNPQMSIIPTQKEPLCELSKTKDQLNETVFKALQTITKQQVQEILAPIMSNIGLLLSEKSPVNVQTLLNGLNSACSPFNNACSTDTLNKTNSQFNIGLNNSNVSLSCIEGGGGAGDEVCIGAGDYGTECKTTSNELPATMRNNNVGDETVDTTSYVVDYNKEVLKRDESTCNLTEPTKAAVKVKEQKIRYAKNVQYTYVKSLLSETEDEQTARNLFEERKISQENTDGMDNIINEEEDDINDKKGNKLGKNKSGILDNTMYNILKERAKYIEQIANNPLYVNENFAHPWKVVSNIADQIVEDVMELVESEMGLGEMDFVSDFLSGELK